MANYVCMYVYAIDFINKFQFVKYLSYKILVLGYSYALNAFHAHLLLFFFWFLGVYFRYKKNNNQKGIRA